MPIGQIIISFAQQTAVLFSAVAVYGLLVQGKWREHSYLRWQLLGGFLSGLLGCLLMVTPWTLRPGVFFDARGVLLSLAGLYFHPTAALIAASMMAAFRYLQGGAGAWPGVGFILSATALGLFWHHRFVRRPEESLGYDVLFGLGVVTHLVMLGWMFALPPEVRWRAVSATALPVLLVFPLATLLAGRALESRRIYRQTVQALEESEARYRLMVELSPDSIGIVQDNELVFANHRLLDLLGVSSMSALRQRAIESLFGEEYRQKLAALLQRGGGEIRNLTFSRPYGDRLFLTIRVAPIRFQGKPAQYLLVHDRTDERQARMDVEERLAELETLFNLVEALSRVHTAQDALDLTLDAALWAVHAKDGAVWLHHADDGQLHSHGARGWFRQLDDTPFAPGEGIGGLVFETCTTYITTAFSRDTLLQERGSHAAFSDYGGACFPLRDDNRCIGVLFVARPVGENLSEHQIRLLESLLAIAGAHIQRLRLLEEKHKRMQYLEAVQSIDNIVLTSWALDSLFTLVLDQARQLLQADVVNLWLYQPESHLLELTATNSADGLHIGQIRHLGNNVLLGVMLQQKPFYGRLSVEYAPYEIRFAARLPLAAKSKPLGMLELFFYSPFQPEPVWKEFAEMFAQQISIAIESNQTFEQLQKANLELMQAYEQTVEGWARALDLRDHETEGHTRRVTEATVSLARLLDIPADEIVHIRRGALLHDIGKMGVPDEILHKPGPLTPEEAAIMRQHPVWAKKLLEPIAYLRPAIDIPYCHHERWDGSGYPQGLRGKAIPLAARIFAVVDVWDALSSDRPYRRGWSRKDVRSYLRQKSGKDFDPRIVRVFLDLLESGELNNVLAQQSKTRAP